MLIGLEHYIHDLKYIYCKRLEKDKFDYKIVKDDKEIALWRSTEPTVSIQCPQGWWKFAVPVVPTLSL